MIVKSCIYIYFNIDILSIKLFGTNVSDVTLKFATLQTTIILRTILHESKQWYKVNMYDLQAKDKCQQLKGQQVFHLITQAYNFPPS